MKDNIAPGRTFWSGVINYVRASAFCAEALKPWDFREEQEAKTVLVFRTSIEEFADQLMITSELNELVGKNNWTIDLDDVDKVLRVVCGESKTTKIITLLTAQGFICEVMS